MMTTAGSNVVFSCCDAIAVSPRLKHVAVLMDDSEHDVLTYNRVHRHQHDALS
jgi:hypothetical protein